MTNEIKFTADDGGGRVGLKRMTFNTGRAGAENLVPLFSPSVPRGWQ